MVIPTLAATVALRRRPNGALYGNILEHQFGATGTWALGSAMGVVLFAVSLLAIGLVWKTVNLSRAVHRGAGVSMAAISPGARVTIGVQMLLLGALYLFLYFPIAYIAYLSLMANSVWPFPPEWYARLQIMSDFHAGLGNSLIIGLGTGVLSALFATAGAIGILRYRCATARC